MGRSAVRRRGLDFDEAFLALCFFRVGFIVGGHTATPCIGEQLGGRKSGPAKTWEARFAVVSSRPPQNSRESPAYGQRFADGALRPVLKSGGVAYPVVGMVGIIDPSTLACLVSDMVLGFVKRYPLGERCIVRVLLALDRGGGGASSDFDVSWRSTSSCFRGDHKDRCRWVGRHEHQRATTKLGAFSAMTTVLRARFPARRPSAPSRVPSPPTQPHRLALLASSLALRLRLSCTARLRSVCLAVGARWRNCP